MAEMSTRSYSHFLNLPAEIRREIYSLFLQPLVQHAKHKVQLIRADARRGLDTRRLAMCLPHLQNTCKETSQLHGVEVKEYFQLLLVCRLVHQEAFPICYNNATFHVRKPLEFANSFLRHAGTYKLSQIRHIEIRLEGIPIGVDGWSCSAPKLSNWNHHQVRTLFENYPELECLATLVIKIEKFADRSFARWLNFGPVYPESRDWLINAAWSQNKDTDAMKFRLSHLKLGKGSRIFEHAFTVIDDDNIDKKDKRSLRTADGRHCCEINMKRIFQAILWNASER